MYTLKCLLQTKNMCKRVWLTTCKTGLCNYNSETQVSQSVSLVDCSLWLYRCQPPHTLCRLLTTSYVHTLRQGRFRGVAAYRMGQLNVLGGYPFHWHLLGIIPTGTSYATDCAVYHSYFRCEYPLGQGWQRAWSTTNMGGLTYPQLLMH